ATASVVTTAVCSLLVVECSAFAAFAAGNPALADRLRSLAASRAEFNERFLAPDETASAVLV
ncbi:MAG TPA: hypothetical protein VGO62_04005, partial [Myxococcota bacterium]